MYARLCKPLKQHSFFIFGARGTGKSTLVRQFLAKERHLVIDLLLADDEERFGRYPQALKQEVDARRDEIDWVFIDEVQKAPKLLDIVHALIESAPTKHIHFALSGSSARKLKVAGANLLAGRSFVNELYPLTHIEMGDNFDIDCALNWGTLPKIAALSSDLERQEFLRAYGRTYVKEEIWDERLVQNLDPFRRFLEVAAQTNGTIVNFSNIAKDVGADDKTVKKYFEILADTFLGFYLEAYHRSIRKQQVSSPKFYLFDPGVKRALEGTMNIPVAPKTFAYGRAFEHFLLCECVRLNTYYRLDYKFSYLRTKDDVEIDLIVERPGQSTVLIEMKSAKLVDERDASALKILRGSFPDAEFQIWSQDSHSKMFDGIRAVHWTQGMQKVLVGLKSRN